jgi:hypothetical protein
VSRLLDHGPHTVTVYVEEEFTDSYGNVVRRPSETGAVVKGCLVTPLSSSRGAFPALDVAQGQRVDQAFKFLARSAPLGWWSRVVWTHGGRTRNLAVLGGPLEHVASDGTRHISATLQEET